MLIIHGEGRRESGEKKGKERERGGSIKAACSVDFQSCYSDCCLFPAALFERDSMAQRHLIILLFLLFFFRSLYLYQFIFPLLTSPAKDSFWTTVRTLEVKSPHKASVQRREAEMLVIGRWTRCLTSLPSGLLVGKLTHGYLWGTTQKNETSLSPLILFSLGLWARQDHRFKKEKNKQCVKDAQWAIVFRLYWHY